MFKHILLVKFPFLITPFRALLQHSPHPALLILSEQHYDDKKSLANISIQWTLALNYSKIQYSKEVDKRVQDEQFQNYLQKMN